nr:S1 RNA-binding domain-containing protein [uncultured Eudoraea sp.]
MTIFGCFVDFTIKESGLIHISNISEIIVKYVKEYVSPDQQTIVKVLDIDVPRKSFQLTLHN